jgi:hypothetical protein
VESSGEFGGKELFMKYRVQCTCGDAISVAECDAGSQVQCWCGRVVEVPSLRELRRQAGEPGPTVSPEMEVEALLLAGKLPEEDRCVLCESPTNGCVSCRTECERAYVQRSGPPLWVRALAFLTFGLIGAAVASAMPGHEQEWGKDRIFSLPLRVCDACRKGLTSSQAMKDALCRVPLYRRLLRKYPAAKITAPAE